MTLLNLDAVLAESAGTVRLFGREQPIKALDLQGWRVVRQLAGGELNDEDYHGQLVPTLMRHLPGATEAEVLTLTPGVVGQILGVAQGMIAEVAETGPKTTGTRTRSRRSSRRTRTASSSSD